MQTRIDRSNEVDIGALQHSVDVHLDFAGVVPADLNEPLGRWSDFVPASALERKQDGGPRQDGNQGLQGHGAHFSSIH
jgi:hypothetical protein